MNYHERLDSYQEASWALAMEKVAVHRGEEAAELEAQLWEDPQAAVPQEILDHGMSVIRKAFSVRPIKHIKTGFFKVLVAVAVCALMTTVACALSPEFKEFILRAVSTIADTFTAITFQDSQTESFVLETERFTDTYNGIQFEWIPEGYEYVDGADESIFKWVSFSNQQGDIIQVHVRYSAPHAAYNYDNEAESTDHIAIGSHQGQIIESEKGLKLVWIDSEHEKCVSIFATGLSQKKLCQMARGLYY